MTLPSTMNCIEITEPGGPDVLKPTTRPLPDIREGDVLIKVHAAGVNRPDCLQREGNYAPPPGTTDIPGLEVAGEVIAIAPDVRGIEVGSKVCALVAGGGYAEYVTAPAPQVMPIPVGLSIVEAAALPETFMTVWTNVFERGRLQAGEVLMVHGASSGIGTTAVQMAHHMGATVIATAGTDEKCQTCLDLGADRAVNYRDDDFVSIAKEYNGGKGVNVILDMVGGDYIERNIKSCAPDGRIVNIAFLRGPKAEVNFMPVMLKRLTLTGSTLRPQSVTRKGEIASSLVERIWPLISDAKIKPVIHTVFSLDQASAAHALMETNTHIGKIMLKITE